MKSRTRSRSRPRILHKAGHITKVSITQCERTPKLVILVDCYRTTLSKDYPPWQGCSLSAPISNWPFKSWTVFFVSILQVLFLLSFPPCNGSKSSPVQSNTRVWYVVELITVNKSPILFCMPYSSWLFGLIKRNLTIRQRRRHENVAEKQTSHHFKLFRDYPIIRPVA